MNKFYFLKSTSRIKFILRNSIRAIIFIFLSATLNLHAEEPSIKSNLKTTRELKNNTISSPKNFTINYKLNGIFSKTATSRPSGGLFAAPSSVSETVYAEVAINILGNNFRPIRTYVLRNITKIDNASSLWDGRDTYGREMPNGDYYAQLAIIYSDNSKETKCYKFLKE